MFCKKGIDSFIKDFNFFDKFIIEQSNISDIDSAIIKADLIWLEWADDLTAYIINKIKQYGLHPKIIVRLHSYEVFVPHYINIIDWQYVDTLIFVSEYIQKLFNEKYSINVNQTVIHNGVNLNKFKFKQHKANLINPKIAVVAAVNGKKNLQLLPFLLETLPEQTTIDIAGAIQEERYYRYIKHATNKINFVGHIDNIIDFYHFHDYLISTSVHEGLPYNIMEAMATGLKPFILYFPYADKLFPKELVFNTLKEFKNLFYSTDYNSQFYRDFIKEHYSLEKQIEKIKNLLK